MDSVYPHVKNKLIGICTKYKEGGGWQKWEEETLPSSPEPLLLQPDFSDMTAVNGWKSPNFKSQVAYRGLEGWVP